MGAYMYVRMSASGAAPSAGLPCPLLCRCISSVMTVSCDGVLSVPSSAAWGCMHNRTAHSRNVSSSRQKYVKSKHESFWGFCGGFASFFLGICQFQ